MFLLEAMQLPTFVLDIPPLRPPSQHTARLNLARSGDGRQRANIVPKVWRLTLLFYRLVPF